MTFTVAKLIAFLVQPSSLAGLALAVGLFLLSRGRPSRAGQRLATGACFYFFAAGLLPLGNLILLPLEQRFPPVAAPSALVPVDGIILLGGFEDGWVSAGRGQLAVNESAERLIETLRLARAHPEARVVFTGGVGNLWRPGSDATGPVAAHLEEAGIGRSRIVLEGRARNTVENARFTASLVEPRAGERWVLVTSAYHMPRAMGLFRRAGFDPLAYPVDFRLKGPGDVWRFFERIPAGLQRTDLAVNEWVGLFKLWIAGEIDAVFPAPD